MKTKNIFRTLLMAAFLLAGANNVKAGETPVWESSFDKNNVVSVEWNNNIQVSEGDKIRIYVYDRNLFVEGNWSTPLELENGKDGSPSFSSYNSTGNYYELKFKENSVSVLKQQGFKSLMQVGMRKILPMIQDLANSKISQQSIPLDFTVLTVLTDTSMFMQDGGKVTPY